MRTKLFGFIIVGTLLATGVVSAYTEPAGSYPNGQVETVVHVGPEQQIKTGAFWAKLLQAGSKVTNTASLAGYVLGETISIAPSGFFTHMVLPGSDSQFRLGGVSTALSETIRDNESNSLFGFIFKNLNKTTDNKVKNILDNNRAPFTIDLAGRGTQGSAASRDALAVIAHGMCSPVAIITDASGISFRSDYNKNLSDTNLQSEYADILARQLRLRRGNPGPEKVLVSVDRLGNAMWGTLKFTPVKNSAGVTTDMKVTVEYDKANSPVRASQMMCGLQDLEYPKDDEIIGDTCSSVYKIKVTQKVFEKRISLEGSGFGNSQNYVWTESTGNNTVYYSPDITTCSQNDGTAQRIVKHNRSNSILTACAIQNGVDDLVFGGNTQVINYSVGTSCSDIVYSQTTSTEFGNNYYFSIDPESSKYKIERIFVYEPA